MSGGGTGGHVYPVLSVLEALQEMGDRAEERRTMPVDNSSVEVLYVGHERGVEASLVPRAGVPFATIAGGQVRGQAPWKLARNLWHIARGYRQARGLVADFRPDVCFITGGWVTVPVALAAWRAGVPLVIYLPDITPGLAVKVLRHLATAVAVTADRAASYFPGKAVVTGYPVRRQVWRAGREEARRALGLPLAARVLLVFGGSRGARSINRALVAGLDRLLPLAHIVHITGPLDHGWVEEAATRLPAALRARYHVYAYLHEEMPLALAAADLVVCRAGASVLGEMPARGLPAVLVPYPYAGRHQAENADYLAERGAAVVVDDARLAEALVPTVQALLDDETRREQMAAAARALAVPDAAERIAHLLVDVAARRGRYNRNVKERARDALA